MRRLISQLVVLSVVVVLARQGAPGSLLTYYGQDGQEAAMIEYAKDFGTVGEAYKKQIELGTGWEILTQ